MGTLGRRALIGRRISESLERSGVSQAELGRRLGRAKSAITRWKTGESLPSVDLLLDVAEITGVEPLWLFGATAADLVGLADEVRERSAPVAGVTGEAVRFQYDSDLERRAEMTWQRWFSAVAVALVAGLVGCGGGAEQAVETEFLTADKVDALVAEQRAGRDAQVAALDREALDVVAAQAQVLLAERQQLREQLAAARADVARYEAGLQRCVSELNRTGRSEVGRIVPNSGRATAPAPAARAKLIAPWLPELQIVEDRIFVNAYVMNEGTADAEAQVTIDLLHDGRRVDSSTVAAWIPAGSTDMVSAEFRLRTGEVTGSYAARVRFR